MEAGVTNEKLSGSPLNPPTIEPCSVKLQPKVQTRKRKPRSKGNDRSEPWGPYTIAPIVRTFDDVQIGWGAVCSNHTDLDHSLECKKQIGLHLGQPNEISVAEGRRLIKAWLMLGTVIDEHHPTPRTEHVFKTDPRTRRYSEAELDDLVKLLQE